MYYLYYWDTLMPAHFSIDTELWKSAQGQVEDKEKTVVKILHAPNHRNLKGTRYFQQAVESLKNEGYGVELIMLEKVDNRQIRDIMSDIDIVADQLIVGWYAMFALEGMSMEKPVLCYLDPDLKRLYEVSGALEEGAIPLVDCRPENVKERIKELIEDKELREKIGRKGRDYVQKYHSTEAIGKVFDRINQCIGI